MTDNDTMKGGEIDIMSLIFVVLQVISYDFNFPLMFETVSVKLCKTTGCPRSNFPKSICSSSLSEHIS